MRISTNQMYFRGLANMTVHQERVNKLQEQIASGLRVSIASDDPIAASQIELMDQRVNYIKVLEKNRQNAESTLSLQEDTLSQAASILKQIRDLHQKAGDGILSDIDRKSLAIEAKSLLSQLQNLANAHDGVGNYLFAGSQSTTQPISTDSSGQYVYNGDTLQRYLPVTGSLQVAVSDDGDSLFMRIRNGNGTFSVGPGVTPNSGSATVSTGSVTNPSAVVDDTYTLTFATNSLNQMVVMVTGVAGGNILPASGLPDDAPVYTPEGTIGFNGIEVSIKGTPVAGDTFKIQPAANESVFATVQRMIDSYNIPQTSDAQKATFQTEFNQLLTQLDTAYNNVLDHQSQIGARLNLLDSAENANSSLTLICEDTLDQLRKADPVEVITNFNMELVNLQGAQQSFVKLQGMSLLNYI